MRRALRAPLGRFARGHPERVVPVAFLITIAVGTLLLLTPLARAGGRPGAGVMPALFTSVSAVCVTGLTTVDTATYWTPFGQTVILVMVQIGGFGVMTMATLLSLLVRGRLGLRRTLVAQADTHSLNLGDVRRVLGRVALTVLTFESLITLVLTIRFRVHYDHDLPTALWHGVFHGVSAFNNAGFALYPDNLVAFVTDGWIMFPICVAVIAGGLGFPVILELRRGWRHPSAWSVHTRLTIYGTAALLGVGIGGFLVFEWRNTLTIGGLGTWGKVVAGVTGGVMPRTAGFNTVDYGAVHPATMALNYALMFIGGGSASTAGGIKVSTFLLLGFVIWTEVRGEPDVAVGNRRINSETQRQALTVALLGLGLVAVATMMMLMMTSDRLDIVLFEVVSAFGTVGLSAGITPHLPVDAQFVLMVLMFVGRVGTITVGAALALNTRPRLYQLPEERPIVG